MYALFCIVSYNGTAFYNNFHLVEGPRAAQCRMLKYNWYILWGYAGKILVNIRLRIVTIGKASSQVLFLRSTTSLKEVDRLELTSRQ